jgi:type III restriction enzyme
VDEGFFERPILKSPYAYPDRHWELDDDGQPTNQILPKRRDSKLLTPVPKPQKCHHNANQPGFVFDSGHGLSTEEQEYNPTSIINEIRRYVEDWRDLPNLDQWQVTLETARLLQHWRHALQPLTILSDTCGPKFSRLTSRHDFARAIGSGALG